MLNKDKLKLFLIELMEVLEDTEIDIPQEIIVEQAIKLYLSESINESKKENIKEMKENRKPEEHKFNRILKPSDKQIAFLKKNKLLIPETLKEATIIIKEFIDNKNKFYGGKK